jgi:hypothetical protein
MRFFRGYIMSTIAEVRFFNVQVMKLDIGAVEPFLKYTPPYPIVFKAMLNDCWYKIYS